MCKFWEPVYTPQGRLQIITMTHHIHPRELLGKMSDRNIRKFINPPPCRRRSQSESRWRYQQGIGLGLPAVPIQPVLYFGVEFGGGQELLAEMEQVSEGGMIWRILEILRVTIQPHVQGRYEGPWTQSREQFGPHDSVNSTHFRCCSCWSIFPLGGESDSSS